MPAEDFLAALAQVVPAARALSSRFARSLARLLCSGVSARNRGSRRRRAVLLDPARSRVLALARFRSEGALYDGSDPDWDDIRAARDVTLGFEADVVQNVRTFLTERRRRGFGVELSLTTRGQAKTTATMPDRIDARAGGQTGAVLVPAPAG